ncbi:MAG: hypothetical protein K2M19_05240 [Muribaculaceae bacterium]|nr:hypothetical protein [Muribaculaceae bacterium]
MTDNRLTLMFMVEDTARADLALTPQRTYYRFATESSIEDGELGAVENFDAVMAELIDAAMPRENESPLPADVKFRLFVNNRLAPERATEESLRRVIAALQPLHVEFAFLKGFV